MAYIVIAIVVFLMLRMAFGLIQTIWLGIRHFIRDHKFLIVSAVIFLACWCMDGLDLAVFAAILCLIVWFLIFVVFKAILAYSKSIHQTQLKRWLASHATQLGQVSTSDMMARGRSASIPDRFIQYSYPDGHSAYFTIDTFIAECQRKLEAKVRNTLYEAVREAGMIDEQSVRDVISRQYSTDTRQQSLSTIFDRTRDELEKEHKLERPTDDKKFLHCVGSTGGTFLEKPQEIDLDIDF